jgi:hypothetical protein
MLVLVLGTDPSLQIALASMSADMELRTASDAERATFEATRAQVVLVDLGTTERSIAATRALSSAGVSTPCIVIGREPAEAAEIARIVARPFTLDELRAAIESAATATRAPAAAAAAAVAEPEAPVALDSKREERRARAQREEEARAVVPGEAAARETVARADAKGDEAARAEAVREEAVREEAVREEAVRDEAARAEHERAEAERARAEHERTELEQAERARAEVERAETERAARAQREHAQAERQRADAEAREAERARAQREHAAREAAETRRAERAAREEESERARRASSRAAAERAAREAAELQRSERARHDGEPAGEGAGVDGALAPDSPPRTARTRATDPTRAPRATDPARTPRRDSEPTRANADADAAVRRFEHGASPWRRRRVKRMSEPGPRPAAPSGHPFDARVRDALLKANDLQQVLADLPILSDPRAVAAALVAEVVDRVGATTAAVYAPPAGGRFVVLAGIGLSPAESRILVSPDHPVMAEVAGDGRALCVVPVDLARGAFAGLAGAHVEAFMAVPVSVGDNGVAVVTAGADDFDAADLETLCELCAEAAAGLALALTIARVRAATA